MGHVRRVDWPILSAAPDDTWRQHAMVWEGAEIV